MKKSLSCFALVVLLGAAIGVPSSADEQEVAAVDDDERLLESAGLSAEGPGLLDFFRARACTQTEPGRVDDLVRRFTGSSGEERVRAGADLVAVGANAVSGLRRVANDLEAPEVRDSAKRCLNWVEGPESARLTIAAARLVARRKPTGAGEVLLTYLPYADNEEVVREVGIALQAVALTNGKADAAVLRALSDPMPLRRAMAGAVLSQAGGADRQAAEKLLQDDNPEVRMATALALAKAHNAAAIPVLIDLLGVLPLAKRTQVEEALQEIAGEWAPAGGPSAEDEIARRIRRDSWAAWWANTDGPALQTLLKKHTLTPEEQDKVKSAIRRLGDQAYRVREKAIAELVAGGRRILPMLRDAVKEADLETARRAGNCIDRIEQEPANRLPNAALRLLALRKPDGAADTLLAYVPFAEEDNLDEVKLALVVLAVRDGKPEPAMLRAISATHPALRAAAAEALAQAAGPEVRPALRKLLADADLSVRTRAAMALAPKDASAVPVLIELIANLKDEPAGHVHDFLAALAGENAPMPPENTPDARKKSSALWAVWWKDNSAKADLAKLSRPHQQLLGFTVVCEHNTGTIVELGRDHKPRWSFGGTRNPTDAWVMPNNRVIVAEYGANLVTMRDIKGKILWQKQMNCNPHNVQGLPNGNVFIAGNVQLAEVDRNGKDVPMQLQNIQQLINNMGQLTGAYKTRNGHYVLMGQNGRCVRLDATGKEIKSFNTGLGNAWLDVTPAGKIIVATNSSNNIREYDADGKLLIDLPVQQVSMVTGLPSGNFLIASHSTGRMYEMDRKGQTVWEYRTNGPFRARGR